MPVARSDLIVPAAHGLHVVQHIHCNGRIDGVPLIPLIMVRGGVISELR